MTRYWDEPVTKTTTTISNAAEPRHTPDDHFAAALWSPVMPLSHSRSFRRLKKTTRISCDPLTRVGPRQLLEMVKQ
jgi:hypothetical protein